LIAFPEREPNRYREGPELRDALGVRDNCGVEISVERQEGFKCARLCVELAVQERDEILADVLVEDEATDLEVVQPAELYRGMSPQQRVKLVPERRRFTAVAAAVAGPATVTAAPTPNRSSLRVIPSSCVSAAGNSWSDDW
jgi:hypothetical protein